VWDWVLNASEYVETWVLSLSTSPWIYVAILAVSIVDAFFPIVPSESTVIAASTTAAATGSPLLAGVWIAAAVGAWCGDQTGRFIGTKINVRRWAFFRRPRVLKTLLWAEHGLEKRGTSLIIAARFIPMGRIAVNLTAGALGYPAKRFMVVTAIAASIWASWGVALGTVAGSLFHDNLLVAVVAGVAGGIILGYLVDVILSRLGVSQPHLPDLEVLADGNEPSHPRDTDA
jgi:membrane protein DedA with SNARE-associated domain